jgi:hypothetical protein
MVAEKTKSMGAAFQVYSMSDIIGNIDLTQGQLDATPIVMVTKRPVQKGMMTAYLQCYNDARAYLKTKVPGMRSMMCSVDK